MAGVVDALLVHVAEVDGTVGADLDVNRAKPLVGAGDGSIDVGGLEGGRVGPNVALNDLALQGFDAEQSAVVAFGQLVGFVDDEVVSEPWHVVVFHGREIAKGVGVGQRSVF